MNLSRVGADSIGTYLTRVTEEEKSDYTYSKVMVTQRVALALHSWEQKRTDDRVNYVLLNSWIWHTVTSLFNIF